MEPLGDSEHHVLAPDTQFAFISRTIPNHNQPNHMTQYQALVTKELAVPLVFNRV